MLCFLAPSHHRDDHTNLAVVRKLLNPEGVRIERQEWQFLFQ